MTSGKMYPKADDAHRNRLAQRSRKALIEAGKTIGKLSDAQKKSPSQKSSEALRRKLNRGCTSADAIAGYDCRGCGTYDTCAFDHKLANCTSRAMTARCKQCGQKWTFRVIAEEKWEYCPKCRSERE